MSKRILVAACQVIRLLHKPKIFLTGLSRACSTSQDSICFYEKRSCKKNRENITIYKVKTCKRRESIWYTKYYRRKEKWIFFNGSPFFRRHPKNLFWRSSISIPRFLVMLLILLMVKMLISSIFIILNGCHYYSSRIFN